MYSSVTTIKASDTLEQQPTVWPVLFLPDGYAMLMRPNKAETAVHGCHCLGDMAVRMRKVLTRPWVGVRVCHLLLLYSSGHHGTFNPAVIYQQRSEQGAREHK